MSAWSLEETRTWSMSRRRKVSSSPQVRASFARPASGRLLPRQSNRYHPAGLRVSQRHDDPTDVGEALLPGRVLDDDRDDVPSVLESGEPQLPGGDREEVGEHEDERARCDRAGVCRQMLDRTLEPVRRPVVLGRPEPLIAELDHLPVALRLAPMGVAVRVVQVADEAARSPGARENQLDDVPGGQGLVEPGERRREARHLRTPIAHDHDLRRLLGKPLAHDELVAPSRGGEPGRRGPVDRIHVVARAVRPGPGDVRAGSTMKAPHRAEGEPDEPPPRHEREDQPGVRHARPSIRCAAARRTDPPQSPDVARARGSSPGTHRSPPSTRSRVHGRRIRGVKTTRWTRTGTKSRSMSSGTT